MATVTADVLSEIHETNILLNSNIMDAREAANETREVSQAVLAGLASLDRETEKNINKAKTDLTKQFQKLEIDLHNEINELTKKSLQKISKDHAELKDTTKFSYDVIQKNLEKQQQRQDQQFQALQLALVKQAREQKELILEVQKNLFAEINVSLANQEKLSRKLSDLKNTLITQNEAQVKKLDEKNLSLKKFQKKWYITTFIAILIGYFL